jgi:predicted nucleotidyltransferase
MKARHFSPDVQDFLLLLSRHQVRLMIVGGEAVIYHGYARLTGDVDFFYERTEINTKRLFAAMKDFWEGRIPGIHKASELMKRGMILQFGRPPNRIDLINNIDGIAFQEAWETRIVEKVKIAGSPVEIPFIGLEALIKNKEASGRDKDRDDLRFLKRKDQ